VERKGANLVGIKIGEAFVNNCYACALCLVRLFITAAISGQNDSWSVCSLIINIQGLGEKNETICLDKIIYIKLGSLDLPQLT